MASTIANYQGNGSTTDFSVPFDYLAKKFVKVIVDSREKLGGDYGDTTKDYFFVDKTTIRFNTAPASGTEIIIRRYTSATDRIVSFKDASVLKAKDLDVSAIQTIHIAEEGRDAINDAIIGDKEGNWDARGRRITNVGAPIKDNDAVNLNYYKKDVEGVYQARLNAEKARDAAKVSEANAKSEADRAKGWADQAVAGQVQVDWSQTDSTQKDYIKNKPTIPTKVSELKNDANFTQFAGASATVDANTGTPSVTVTESGSGNNKGLVFSFKNLKGAKGDKGDTGAKGDKGDAGTAYITEAWSDKTSWYRKWSDGWIEQGGTFTKVRDTNISISFPKAFKDTNYTIVAAQYQRTSPVNGMGGDFTSKTTTGFAHNYGSWGGKWDWQASGF